MMDADTRARAEKLLNDVQRFRDRDISHSELGGVGGFHEAEALKRDLAEWFADLLAALLDVGDSVDPSLAKFVLKRVGDEGRNLGEIEEEIDQLARDGLHTPRFQDERAGLIDALRQRSESAKLELQLYRGHLRGLQLEKAFDSGRVSRAESAAEARVRELERVVGEATKSLATLQARAMTAGVSTAERTFETLSRQHRRVAFIWIALFWAAACLTAWAVLSTALIAVYPMDLSEICFTILKRVLLVSVPAVFMRIALSKFNLETNLRVPYAHREVVLAQYKTFEVAIGDDALAKNQFRLEIAKYIFADPVTGYVSADAGSEININPVIGMLDKIIPGSK